jgi:hypothetical protein
MDSAILEFPARNPNKKIRITFPEELEASRIPTRVNRTGHRCTELALEKWNAPIKPGLNNPSNPNRVPIIKKKIFKLFLK